MIDADDQNNPMLWPQHLQAECARTGSPVAHDGTAIDWDAECVAAHTLPTPPDHLMSVTMWLCLFLMGLMLCSSAYTLWRLWVTP